MPAAITALLLMLAVLVPSAHAGTYEHRSLSASAPELDGWSPAVFAPGGHVSAGLEGVVPWAGFFDRNPFAPGELGEWAYAAPAGTTIDVWGIDREVAGIGPGDWNTLFYAVSGDRWRLVAHEVPSANRAWERLHLGGLDADRVVARLVCGGPRACHRGAAGTTLKLHDSRVRLRDASAPAVSAVQGDLAERPVLAGKERLSFSASDRGGGVYRTLIEVDGLELGAAVVDPNGGRCRDLVPGGELQTTARVPCPLSASATAILDTTHLADGRHTIVVRVEDAAGNRTTVFGPATRTVANRTASPAPPPERPPAVVAPPPAAAPPPPGAAPARRAVVHAWLERGRRRLVAVTARYGDRIRIRGRVTDAEGGPLRGAPLRLSERLIDGFGRPVALTVLGDRRPVARTTQPARPSFGTADRRPRVPWTPVTGLRTRSDGRFTAFTRIGPSRRIRISGPHGARGPRLTLRVRAPISLRSVTRGVARGRLRGGYVPRTGALVELQARAAGRWQTRRVVRTRRSGRFAARLPGVWKVRARVPRQPGLPYAVGVSPPRTAGRTGAGTSR